MVPLTETLQRVGPLKETLQSDTCLVDFVSSRLRVGPDRGVIRAILRSEPIRYLENVPKCDFFGFRPTLNIDVSGCFKGIVAI